jgi:hypothetical protein
VLAVQCGEYEESDSGYSDPSPDGGGQMREGDNKSPSDRKSVLYSDLSEEEEESEDQHDIFPTVIIKNQVRVVSKNFRQTISLAYLLEFFPFSRNFEQFFCKFLKELLIIDLF